MTNQNRSEVSYWINDTHICTIPSDAAPKPGSKIRLRPRGSQTRKIIRNKEATITEFGTFVVDKIDIVINLYTSVIEADIGETEVTNVIAVQEHQVHLVPYEDNLGKRVA